MTRERAVGSIVLIIYMAALTPAAGGGDGISRGVEVTERASVMVKAAEGGEVELGGARVKIPAGALEKDTEIGIEKLRRVAETGEDLVNVTGLGAGYRFSPHGTAFRRAVEVELPYARELEGLGRLEDVESYYYEERERKWVALERVGIDRERGVIVSETRHFTDMINGTLSAPESPEGINININSIKGLEGAHPLGGVGELEGFEGNSEGSAGFQLKIRAPGGRRGMAPSVAVTYRSGGGNGIAGRGFDISYGSVIEVDTRWGAVRYGEGDKYIKDGVLLEKDSEDGYAEWYKPLREVRRELIERVREGNYWEVTGTDGRKRVYGKGGDSWGGPDANNIKKKNIWYLEEERDEYGNTVKYLYRKDGGTVYPHAIVWTGNGSEEGIYRIDFEYDMEGGKDVRKDVRTDGRGGYLREVKKRIKRLVVKGNGAELRRYEFEYREGVAAESVVEGIEVAEGGPECGPEDRYRYSFEYYEVPKDKRGYQYFGDPKPWGEMPLGVTRGTSSGGQFSGGAGVGIGEPSGNVDVRGNGGVSYSYGGGVSNSEWTVADINGDGIADSVRQAGRYLKIRLGSTAGFREEKTVAVDGLDEVMLEQERNTSSAFGWNAGGGVGTPFGEIGPTFSTTTQSGSSSLASSLMDLDGDGLADIVISGSLIYYKNISEGENIGFAEQSIGIAGEIYEYQPELTDKERAELDEAFYQQRPFRMWKAPYEGRIAVEETVRKAEGVQKAEGGGTVAARTYRGAEEEAEITITIEGAETGAAGLNGEVAAGDEPVNFFV